LSVAEVGVLACIYGGRRRTVRDLVTATALRPSTLTSVLGRLERRELIVRTENVADRRSVSVRLTSAGREHARQVVEASSALECRLPLDDIRRVQATLDEVV
jgi:DNA-binding MarR family transcriptional regulator